ncbi:hypothetical protein GZZ44_10490 [Klebsiella aerogenes]|uniref:hypothetical protein n=1 Tax=Klebsiella aerogenes TaxID=548 RepID=UPI00190EF0F9|nr:hypothetical protein [Klebsiella aerogenes]MBK0633375.1 hypothetical protein [Klebsiella aerogenes]
MAQTALQDQRQNEQAEAGYEAATPVAIDPGSTVPPFYQTNHVAAEMAKNPQITPPTTGEIHKQMWVSSMMMGLMTALATGNVAGGLAGGMWAAIGVHDYGYALRQRSQYIDQLKGDGYSFPSILKWYEDGDSKELDKERQDMLQRDRMAQQDKEFNQRLEQQDRQFNQRQAQQASEFGQRMAMEGARIGAMERHQSAMERIAQARLAINANATQNMSLAHLNPLMTSLSRPHNTELRTLQQKQGYLDQLNTDIDLIRKGNPAGRNALLTAVAGVDNPNISPREGAIERIQEVGGLSENLKNWLAGHYNGTFSDEMLAQLSDFAAAHQRDTDMERQKIHNQVYAAAKPFTNPNLAGAIADTVAGGGLIDSDAPGIATTGQQHDNATGQMTEQQEKTADNSTPKTVDWSQMQ